MDTSPLDADLIVAGLANPAFPRTVSCHGPVGSTMDVARELLQRLADSQLPALVVADEQTAGRGRLGRPWVAPPGSALLASLALRPLWLAPERGVALVWMAAVALCEAVEEVTSLSPGLKWPNDLLVAARRYSDEDDETDALAEPSYEQAPPQIADHHPRSAAGRPLWAKAAGLLLEVTLGAGGIEAAIIGCGINVSAAPPAGATRYPATSLAEAAGAPVSRLALLQALLRRLDAWHSALQAGEEQQLFEAWRARLITLGQQVAVETPGGRIEGLAEAVDRDGGLIVRDAAGVAHTVSAGDVGLAP
jgi:BirA family biotin operon repressor/biotin-[acetyl-CoA-carboxylase] ligase